MTLISSKTKNNFNQKVTNVTSQSAVIGLPNPSNGGVITSPLGRLGGAF